MEIFGVYTVHWKLVGVALSLSDSLAIIYSRMQKVVKQGYTHTHTQQRLCLHTHVHSCARAHTHAQ